MLNRIKINYDVLEMMVFFWESMSSKEKVVDAYCIEVSEKTEMAPLYGKEFTKESVRKVMSALSNRELVNHPTKKESRFWNNNMWMTEDMDNMKEMLQSVKLLNLDHLKEEYTEQTKSEEINIVFVPGHEDTYYVDGNTLTINFFKLIADFLDGSIKIEGKPMQEFIEEKVKELL